MDNSSGKNHQSSNTDSVARRYKKERVGIVISNKMQKTVVVLVKRLTEHPQYKKVISLNKKYKAHDEKSVSKPGDKVLIRETRPVSKTKRWKVVEVIKS